ncbi:MFS transporter [Amnibacterium sp. CER49]|uniref:MFS transporter n=1 Tax=Amnibacterium sp. CER49 TaxID=3039161 RepID=UPI002447F07C|nr:MFS transporter [Amnibacterium sp. CER49]MDH2444464.1 MFS transporter [Amnibacterium sp. CER49]
MSEATVPATATGPAAQRLLWAAILASFVAFLDGSIVNIALPAIDRDLHGGVVLQQWVVDGYLLTLSALILVAGAVSDRFGRLRVLRIAVVAFTVTSLLCAISPTGVVLVIARLLQGVAGALLVPGSLSLIIATFEGDAQGRAIGRWTAWTSVSFLVGPLVGGLLVDAVGWRSVFALSVLPALGALLLLGRARDEARTEEAARFDVLSAALAALGLAGVVTGLIQLGAERSTLPPWAGTALLVTGAVLLVGFVVVDRRTTAPLVPPALFRSGNFAAGNAATLFIYAGLNLLGFVPALFLQQVVRLPATAAALVGLPSTVLMILLSGRFGALAGRFGPRLFMTVGPLVAATGAVVMSFVRSPEGAVPLLVAGVVLSGIGVAATVAPLTAAVLGAVPASESGIGSAVNNAVARVAGLVATACVGFVLGGVVAVPGFIRASLVTAALLAAGGLVSLAGIRNPPRSAAGRPGDG